MESSTARINRRFQAWKKRVRLLLAGALLLGGTAWAADRFDEERKALAKAKAQALVAEERAAKIEALAAAEASQADSARNKAAAIAARIQATEADLSAAEARIALIEKLRTEQRLKLAQQQEPLTRLLAALQVFTRKPTALMLLQPGSTRDAVHLRAVLAHMAPILRKRTEGLRKEIARGAQLRGDAERAAALLDSTRDRLAEQRKELMGLAATHRTAADKLKGSALAEEDRAIALGEEARDITGLMNRLNEDAGSRNRLANLPGPVLRPDNPAAAAAANDQAAPAVPELAYRLPVSGTLVSGLGDVSDTGVRSRGISIAPRGEALVVAPSSGRVVFAGPFKGYGRIVILDHGGNWTSLVTGMEALYVKVGDQLIQGSPMGRVGSMRPTVTVELRRGTTPVDITRLVG